MKTKRWPAGQMCALITLAVSLWLCEEHLYAQTEMPRRRASSDANADERTLEERRANDMINNGRSLLEAGQDERAIKLLQQVPRMFPGTRAELRARSELGKFYLSTGAYGDAIAQYRLVAARAKGDQHAEALFRLGACHYELNDIDQALVQLRRVTLEHRWSIFANEAYYYIGLCHFRQKRWSKANEALKMVGLSVPSDTASASVAEAGQRLYVKVRDKDLEVMMRQGRTARVEAHAQSGDVEQVVVEPVGRGSADYVGSLPTESGAAQAGDGILQFRGGDVVVEVHYIDENTEMGDTAETRIARVSLVSSAAGGFCDGALRHYVNGVFADQPAFVKVKDLDLNVSEKADTLTVRITSRYRAPQAAEQAGSPQAGDVTEEWQSRDARELVLTETGPETGVFSGTLWPRTESTNAISESTAAADPLSLRVREGDELVLSYTDEAHLAGTEPVSIEETVPVVLGRVPDVQSIEYKASDLILQARKRMVEARIFLKWAQIFHEVGLLHKAVEKSDEGLRRADEVMRIAVQIELEREIIEETYRARWELLIVQGRHKEAIDVCRALTDRYPDSRLADLAFLNIALARLQGGEPTEAIPLFQGVLGLQQADPNVKAEAQYSIGLAQEMIAQDQAEESGQPVNLSAAVASYQRTAEAFPNSHFAGEALKKNVNYYILAEDYPRALELLERVVRDYPDKPWLDDMVLKWGIASFRMGNPEEARRKFTQVVEEYPGTKASVQAKKFLATLGS